MLAIRTLLPLLAGLGLVTAFAWRIWQHEVPRERPGTKNGSYRHPSPEG